MTPARIQARISGMGWVSKSSMGYPGHVLETTPGLTRISAKQILQKPHKSFGRMDDFSRAGFSAIAFALADAGLPGPQKHIGIIASSTTGCLETDALYQATLCREKGVLPSPALFAYTLPSCFLGEAAIYHGLTGESFMIEETQTNGLMGLSMAMDLLEQGNCTALVCGLCNSDLDPKTQGPFPGTGSIEPGALFFVLERQAALPCHGTITQDKHGFSHDNKKITSLTDLGKNILPTPPKSKKTAQGIFI